MCLLLAFALANSMSVIARLLEEEHTLSGSHRATAQTHKTPLLTFHPNSFRDSRKMDQKTHPPVELRTFSLQSEAGAVTLGGAGEFRDLCEKYKGILADLQQKRLNIDDERGDGLVLLLVGQGREKIWGHLDIVSARCPFVETAADWKREQQWDETGHMVLEFPHLTWKAVYCCMEFIYSGECTVDGDVAWGVLHAAKYLDLSQLVEECSAFILEHCDVNNLWRYMENGQLLGCVSLVEGCTQRLAQNAMENFSHPDIGTVATSAALVEVLQRVDLDVDEHVLAEILLGKWVPNTAENTQCKKKVLQCICWDQVLLDDPEFWTRMSNEASTLVNEWKPQVERWKSDNTLNTNRYCECAFRLVPEDQRYARSLAVNLDISAEDVAYPRGTGPCVSTMQGGHAIVSQGPLGELDATKSFTVQAWVRFKVADPRPAFEGTIVGKHGMASGWELRANSSFAEFLVTLVSHPTTWHEVVRVAIHPDVGVGNWMHFVGTFDGRRVMLYVDGRCEDLKRISNWNTDGSRPIPSDVGIVPYRGPMRIGQSHAWSTRRCRGDICGVEVWTDRVLEPPF